MSGAQNVLLHCTTFLQREQNGIITEVEFIHAFSIAMRPPIV